MRNIPHFRWHACLRRSVAVLMLVAASGPNSSIADTADGDGEYPGATKAISACERLIEAYQESTPPKYGGKPHIVTADNPLVGQTFVFRGEVVNTNASSRTVTIASTHHYRMSYSVTSAEQGKLDSLQNNIDSAKRSYEAYKRTRGEAKTKSQKEGRRNNIKAHLDKINSVQKALGDFRRSLRERTDSARHLITVFVGSAYPVAAIGDRVEAAVVVRAMSWNNNAFVPTMEIFGTTVDAAGEYNARREAPDDDIPNLASVLAQCNGILADFTTPQPNETTLAKQERHAEVMSRVDSLLKERSVRFDATVIDVERRPAGRDALRYQLSADLIDPLLTQPQRLVCIFDDYVSELTRARRGDLVPLIGRVLSVEVDGYQRGGPAKYEIQIRVMNVENTDIRAVPEPKQVGQ